MLALVFVIGFLALIAGLVWLIIALIKKRKAANSKGWLIPSIILAVSVVSLVVTCPIVNKQIARDLQRETEADSVFAWTIAEDPDTASIQDVSKAVEIFKRRDWDIPEDLRAREINLHLMVSDSISREVKTLDSVNVILSDLRENELYKELNSEQKAQFEKVENRLLSRGADLQLTLADSVIQNAKTSAELDTAAVELGMVSFYEPLSQSQQRKVNSLRRELERKVENVEAIDFRKEFARMYASELITKGLGVIVTTSGRDATILELEAHSFTGVDAYQLTKAPEFFQTLRELGFSKFVVTNGEDTWSWDL